MDQEEVVPQQQAEGMEARLKVQELALLEVLHVLSKSHGREIADGLRARLNEWALLAGPEFTPAADEAAAEQLTLLLEALDDRSTSVPVESFGSYQVRDMRLA